jgi:hypothetical protein
MNAELHLLRGTHNVTRHGARPSAAAAENVVPMPERDVDAVGDLWKPTGLGKAGAQEWDRLAALLRAQERLGAADGPLLEATCRALDLAARLRRRGDRARGHEALRFMTAERQALDQYRRGLNDLLLTATTNSRVPKPQKPGRESDAQRQRRQRFFGI